MTIFPACSLLNHFNRVDCGLWTVDYLSNQFLNNPITIFPAYSLLNHFNRVDGGLWIIQNTNPSITQ